MAGRMAINRAIMTGHMAEALKTEALVIASPSGIRRGRDTSNSSHGRTLKAHTPTWGTLRTEERPRHSMVPILEEFHTVARRMAFPGAASMAAGSVAGSDGGAGGTLLNYRG